MAEKGKFFIKCKNDKLGNIFWRPVMATVMTHRGFHLIIHEGEGGVEEHDWRVSEMITGMSITSGHELKSDAKKAAIAEIEKYGAEKLVAEIYHQIELNGASPRFAAKEG